MAGRRKKTETETERYIVTLLKAGGIVRGYEVYDLELSQGVRTFRITARGKWPKALQSAKALCEELTNGAAP
jgi:hypothetical protein